MGTQNTGFRIKRILVPTDFSEASRQALPFAVPLAEQFGATLTLLHVVPTALPADISHIGLVLQEKELQAAAEKHLAQFRQTAIRSTAPVETVVRTGGPYHQISEVAREIDCDLIVISTHGHTGLKHVLLGSTAERVVRHAPCPVLTVRAALVGDSFPPDHAVRIKKVLVPTDLSESSHQALHYAAALAREFHAAITLLYVVEPPPYPRFGYAHVPMKEHEQTQAAQAKLDELRTSANLPSELIPATRVRVGAAAQEIVQAAQELGIDLIIQATRGYSDLKNVLLGSTTEKVVRHATCPVLAVREREFIPLQQ